MNGGGLEDDLDESTPLLVRFERQTEKYCGKKALRVLAISVLIIILISCIPITLYQLKTCPSFPSDPKSNITCDRSHLTHGSTCSLTCSPMTLSSSTLQSTCTWSWTWTEDLTCRPQAVAIIGTGFNQTDGQWKQALDIYPPTGSKSSLPGIPLFRGSAAYIDGAIVYCGGDNIQDTSQVPLKSCYSLKHPEPEWVESFPLLQETQLASTAVIEDGRAMLVLGGGDTSSHILATAQIVRPGKPTELGHAMTEETLGHCSTTLTDGSVIVTGGRRRSNPGGSNRTEIYNFTTRKWKKMKDMKQRRFFHSCTQVWLNPHDPDSPITGIVTKSSILGVMVAGGSYLDDDNVPHSALTVELYLPWSDSWMDLPDLPSWAYEDGTVVQMTDTNIVSLPIASDTYSVVLLGGEHVDWDTGEESMNPNVWELVFNNENKTYTWDYSRVSMDMAMEGLGAAAVRVPDTFFSSFRL